MEYKIETLPGYIRAEMVERDTAEETAEFVQALLATLRAQAAARVLISTRKSRPVFKVEQWKLSETLEQLMGMSGVRIAFIADTREIALSQEYIALLGRQRGLQFETFDSEPAAVAWLLADARS
ncbi:MAG TPA: hypothetical protein VNP36_21100 [Burkholderiales bacterium]|nr:hypothetical protein [Burkholderiales bacterium]